MSVFAVWVASVSPAAGADVHTVDGQSFDLVVYGATPGGVATAVRAAREGLNVLLVQHNSHLGGMLTNGLGVWDTMVDGARAPLYDELRRNIEHYYREEYGEDSTQYRASRPGPRDLSSPRGYYEPHVAERLIEQMVAAESRLSVLRNHYPERVQRQGRLLQSVVFRRYGGPETQRVSAAIFADGSYEGDLLAAAGVPYRVGRESRDAFNEPHAGVVFCDETGTEDGRVKFPTEAIAGRLNVRGFRIEMSRLQPGSTGTGDSAIQAFNFRLCLTSDPSRILLPQKPANYNREEFLAARSLSAGAGPNRKSSFNGCKLPGENHAYAEGDWPTREAITRRHLEYSLGWLYFAQNDESLPPDVRTRNRRVGLPNDEFTDNGHVPYEMYVREARRLVGRYTFSQHDALLAPGIGRAPVHADSIAITEWPMDSHQCTTRTGPAGGPDGKIILTEDTRPGQVPYRCLLSPDVDNLLVPVCCGSTHVGWGTIRLEPTWMNLGESAGHAAALAMRKQCSPAEINRDQLLKTLAEARVMLTFFNDLDLAADAPWIAAAQYFGAKGFFADYHLRAGESLKATTARVWIDALHQLHDGKLDPRQIARSVARAEQSTEPITAFEFAVLFPAAKLSGNQPLTRGDALVELWQQLP